MRDQAERLRELARKTVDKVSESETKVIAVASGKGGVGKTNFVVNLALALQEAGKRTIIFDADMGMANIDIVLGVVPNYTLAHVVRGQKTLDEIVLDGPKGVKMLPGSSGAEDLVNLTDYQVKNLINQWNELEGDFDYLLVDTGAGIHTDVINFLTAAEDVVVVLTPEPPSITDAYGLIKVLAQRDGDSKIHLIVNQVTNEKEGQRVFKRVSRVVDEFLHAHVNFLGFITYDDKVIAAVKRQKPFFLEYPNAKASKEITSIMEKLIDKPSDKSSNNGGMKKFLNKVIGFFNSSS